MMHPLTEKIDEYLKSGEAAVYSAQVIEGIIRDWLEEKIEKNSDSNVTTNRWIRILCLDQPKWCEHMSNGGDENMISITSKKWANINPNFCPICGAKKP